MPRLVDYFDADRDGDLDFADVSSYARSTWASFTDFCFRDNVLEVAVGLIFASTFTAVANSLVSDIILPIIALLPFISRNIEEKFLILQRGHSSSRYNTVSQALEDGALVWPYGQFLDKVFRFFLIALALFLIAKSYSWLASDNIIKRQIRCRYCRKYISENAKRCFECTSWQDGREDNGKPAAATTDSS